MRQKIPKQLRWLIYNIFNNQCCLCGSKHLLQIHHLDYSNPITIEKLELRCFWCHILEHSYKFDEMLQWGIEKYGYEKVFAL